MPRLTVCFALRACCCCLVRACCCCTCTGEHVWTHLGASEREGGSTVRVTVLTPAACSTMGHQAWWCRGTWFCVRWVLTRSGALHARMNFDQRALGHLGTDRTLHARLTTGAGPHDHGQIQGAGGCSPPCGLKFHGVCLPPSTPTAPSQASPRTFHRPDCHPYI
jgi:hypothetical protein